MQCMSVAWWCISLYILLSQDSRMASGKSHRGLSDGDYHSSAILTNQTPATMLYQISESRLWLTVIKNWLHILDMCCTTIGAKCLSCATDLQDTLPGSPPFLYSTAKPTHNGVFSVKYHSFLTGTYTQRLQCTHRFYVLMNKSQNTGACLQIEDRVI